MENLLLKYSYIVGIFSFLDEEIDAQGENRFDKVYQENMHWSL